MQEHVTGVDHCDGLAERHSTHMREVVLTIRNRWIVEQRLDRVGLRTPCGGRVVIDRRTTGQCDASCSLQGTRETTR